MGIVKTSIAGLLVVLTATFTAPLAAQSIPAADAIKQQIEQQYGGKLLSIRSDNKGTFKVRLLRQSGEVVDTRIKAEKLDPAKDRQGEPKKD